MLIIISSPSRCIYIQREINMIVIMRKPKVIARSSSLQIFRIIGVFYRFFGCKQITIVVMICAGIISIPITQRK